MQMRKKLTIYSFALLGILVLLNSCKKEYETIESIDDAKIQAYIKQNNLTMTKDPSGFYYQVVQQGTGDVLQNKDSVFYTFNIKSLSGVVYQETKPYTNYGTYLGYITPTPFRIAIANNLKRGGSVKLIIPSHLAFGKNGSGNIPSNEVVVAEVSTNSQKTQWELDDNKIITFLTAKGITATKDPSRAYYNIITPGTGTEAINLNSTIVANYKVRHLDGTVLEESTAGAFSGVLGALYKGWQIILPNRVTAGGKLRLVIPSDLAGPGEVNVLDFDIEIVSVTN